MKRKTLIPLFLTGMVLPLALGAALQGQESARAGAAFIGEYTQTQKNEYIKHGEALNSQMANEGFVLLKNDGSLPMKKGSKLSVIGKSSTNLSRGGAGSGAGSITSGVTAWDLQKSLTEAGFVINDSLTEFYKDSAKSGAGRKNGNTSWRGISQVEIGETPMSSYDAELLATLDEYNDAAVQVITREGSEGCDVKAIDARDSNSAQGLTTKHALELSYQTTSRLYLMKQRNTQITLSSSSIHQTSSSAMH